MKTITLSNRQEWRQWLAKYHNQEKAGIWLVYFKKATGKPSIPYEASVEEALCYGWIDSIIRKLDEQSYCRKFTPRKPTSKWSALNKRRVARLIKQGRMTEHGMKLIEAAKASGMWNIDPTPKLDVSLPEEFKQALQQNKRAKEFFDKLAPSYRKHYLWWIGSAKRAETKAKRIHEAIGLLEAGKKLGMK